MTEPARKVLKKKGGLQPKQVTLQGQYSEFSAEDQFNGLSLRIRELEAQHYMHNLALVEIEAVAENHSKEDLDDALSARRIALSDLELQIERLIAERAKMGYQPS